ncbi:MAG: hypothetical protein AAGB93_16355 [Planctomycetota bacterium]
MPLRTLAVAAPFAALAAPALAQLDCNSVEELPLDVFRGSAPGGLLPQEVHSAALSGDLAVVDAPLEPVGTVGEVGALYVHRREADGWVLEQRLDLFDALAPQTGFSDFADQWALAEDTLFVRYRDGSLPASPRRVAVFESVDGLWQKTQTIDSDPAFFQTGIFGSLIAADGGRLVIGSFASIAFQGFEPGTLENYERDAGGTWQRVQLTTGVNVQPTGPREVALEGDRLAVLYGDLLVFGARMAGWTLEHEVDVESLPSGTGGQTAVSVAVAGDRAVLGGFDEARTFVFDVSAPGTTTLLQEIAPYTYPGRDFNPPYTSLVAAEGDFLVVAVAEDWVGYPTIRLFEWVDDAYRPFDVLRAGAGVSAVSIDGARAFVAAPWLPPDAPVDADARLEVRPLDGARAVPHCGGSASLLASGSGAAPFEDARVHGYELPPGATVLLVAGPVPGATIVGKGRLCIDAAQGLGRFGAPLSASTAGGFAVDTDSMDLSAVTQWLVAGASFTLQGVYRDAGEARVTNALRIRLCD